MKIEINKILIANRSEIASRIIYACKALDIKTVAIYTPEDKHSHYVYQADEVYPLSLEGAEGHLNQNEILKIAKTCKADAIHPGYGFLAENSEFAKKVISADFTWIGPSPENIKYMGDKIQARNLMQKAGVPIIPGFHCKSDTNLQTMKDEAKRIGYPVLLKAALGGGGKAIRKIEDESNFDSTLEIVNLEAKNFFGSSEVFIEKYISQSRHIEVQIAGDGEDFVHLFERECSIQRRHQKVIEETPCTFISQHTLNRMYKTAISVVKSIAYKNIGTVEFILDPDENFYFLEMNTRLQVEHPITELTTGIDLVTLQINIAKSKKLPISQSNITKQGHAIECRILAEDPANNFAPSTGKIVNLNLPSGPFIRHDHILEEGQEVQPFFDPMLSKLIAFGQDRNAAKQNMLKALDEFNISQIKTNIDFLKHLLKSEEFATGNIHTSSLNSEHSSLRKSFSQKNISSIKKDTELEAEDVALIAALLTSKQLLNSKNLPQKQNTQKLSNWRRSTWK